MTYPFLRTLDTPGIRAAREANGVGELWETTDVDRPADRFSPNETAFIAERDSFYLATVSQTGWPYIQHRGGPRGFLRVLDESTLGFADFRGNRQYLTLGNLVDDDRVALFLMDYPRRRRLKILAHMSAHDLKAEARPRRAARHARISRARPSAASRCGCTPSIGTARSTSRRVSRRTRSKRPLRRSAPACGTWKPRTRACAVKRSPLS